MWIQIIESTPIGFIPYTHHVINRSSCAIWFSDQYSHQTQPFISEKRTLQPDQVDPVNYDVAEEREWPAMVRSGNDHIFERMFNSYAPRLASFAYSYVRSRAIAEELVQDIFLWIWQNRETWNVSSDLKTYLYGATRNAALGYLKREKIQLKFDSHTAEELTGSGKAETAENEMIREELTQTVYNAIDKLSETRRVAVTLRWIHGLSYAQIAEVTGAAPKTIEKQLYRAFQDLKKILEGRI